MLSPSLQPAVAPPDARHQPGALPERLLLETQGDLQVGSKARRRFDDQGVDLVAEVAGVARPPVSSLWGSGVEALRDKVTRPHLLLHQVASAWIDADAAQGQTLDGAFRELAGSRWDVVTVDEASPRFQQGR